VRRRPAGFVDFAKRLWPLALSLACLACGEQGVSLGSEDLCVLDPRLAAAMEQSSSPTIQDCAVIGQNLLVNAGFEAPAIELVTDCAVDFCQVPAREVTGWRTTSATQVIEIWTGGYYDVPSPDGAQFAELDADTPDTLYQDLVLAPGELVYWSVLHRGRVGRETVEVFLGASDDPVSQALITTDTGEWVSYSGIYRVSDAEPVTRFALTSRTGSSQGNLVDAAVLAPIELPP
jgi:hypothetical protein